jgi:hypothetical protein
MSEEPRPKVWASSKEKSQIELGAHPPKQRPVRKSALAKAIHPRAQPTCNSTRHYLGASREGLNC